MQLVFYKLLVKEPFAAINLDKELYLFQLGTERERRNFFTTV